MVEGESGHRNETLFSLSDTNAEHAIPVYVRGWANA
jgi:hypothetical protein